MDNIVISFGTFDLFHVGHLRILKRAMKMGNSLYVGVSSDAVNVLKKNRPPIISCEDRMSIIGSISGVTGVFVEDTLNNQLTYCKQIGATTMVMGHDHIGKFDYLRREGIDVIYLPRTGEISTTALIAKISSVP
jgi:glycerol-3-phosphate cytidylyltransferase